MTITLLEINQILLDYKYLILFPVTMIEGPIVTVIAGFLVSLNKLNFYISFFIIIFGDLAGDYIYYLIGRFGKETIIKKFNNKFGFSEEKIINLENHFKINGGKTMLAGKLSHGIGSAFLVAAGIAKMPVGKFFWYNLLGTIPKSLFLLIIGYHYGNSIKKINSFLELSAIIIMTIGIIFLAFYFYHPRKKR